MVANVQLLRLICRLFEQINERMHPEYRMDLEFFVEAQILQPAKTIGADWPQRKILAAWLRKGKANCEVRSIMWENGKVYFANEVVAKFVGTVGIGLTEVRKAIENYAKDGDMTHRVFAALALSEGWCDDKTFRLLNRFALKDQNESVRLAAVSCLSRYFSHKPQTLPVMMKLALEDISDTVRLSAIGYLANVFYGDARASVK